MILELLIFIILFLLQLSLAIYSVILKRSLPKTYSNILGDLNEAAHTLEKYSRIFRQVNLKVNASIKQPAMAIEEFVFLRKDNMYSMDLYTNYYLIYQLELSKKENNFARKFYFIQNLIFIIELFLVASVPLIPAEQKYIPVIAAIGVTVFSIGISIVSYLTFEFILQDVQIIAEDLLNFDDVEKARAETLKKDLKFESFEYPAHTIRKILKFFVPFL